MPPPPTVPSPPLDDVCAAIAVLASPDGPGPPWTAAQIADALPTLAADYGDGPGLAAVAVSARWICAIDAGHVAHE